MRIILKAHIGPGIFNFLPDRAQPSPQKYEAYVEKVECHCFSSEEYLSLD